MSVPVLALFDRTLRRDARSFWAAGLRLVILIGIFVVLGVTALQGALGAPGYVLFSVICQFNLILITLAGVTTLAYAITEEKEERTLGSLRMTGLSAVAILLGKSSSRALVICLYLALQLPFTLLSITLGGIGLDQVLAAYCCLGAYLLLIANVGFVQMIPMLVPTAAGVAVAVVLTIVLFVAALGFFWVFILRRVRALMAE